MQSAKNRMLEIEAQLRQDPDLPIGPAHRLARRLERAERRKPNEVLPIYVVVVGISRHYGGPEEGGWWYDWREILEVRRVWAWRAARQVIRALQEEHPTCRYGRGSVLGGTDVYVDVYSDPSYFPKETTERPRYE